ncbi:MAG: hypothetical protein K8E66_08095 [Phycisphaerales bacterium]|nr:hypothetical protein [Phycisphaerales bacterium]
MRYVLLMLALISLLLSGCTSIKRKAELNNPPPISAGGGPMDPNKPQAQPGAAPADTSGETETPTETSTETSTEGEGE